MISPLHRPSIPRSRVVRNRQMGRMLFLQRKYADAVAELDKTLAVDPEDLEAHYNLMLCYRGLNNDDLASREEKLYLRFKADESTSRAITGPFKITHPDDNNEAQPVHGSMSLWRCKMAVQSMSIRSRTRIGLSRRRRMNEPKRREVFQRPKEDSSTLGVLA